MTCAYQLIIKELYITSINIYTKKSATFAIHHIPYTEKKLYLCRTDLKHKISITYKL